MDSVAGEGTTVRIELPVTRTSVSDAPPSTPPSHPTAGRVLVMDDEPAVRSTAGALLRQLGYAVELAEHGEQAVTLWRAAQERAHPFDLVILDLTVRDGMGGIQALHALRTLCPEVIAVASSGYTDDPVLLDPPRHGFQGALVKPYRLADLQASLAKALER